MSPRAGLHRASVVQAAAARLDAAPNGWETLSLADLAESLGVRTPSLYKHIDGLPALRREMTLLALNELGDCLMQAAVGRSSDEAVVACAHAYRRFAHEHPGLYAATQRVSEPGDRDLEAASGRVVGVMVRVLAAYGLEGDDALHAVRLFRSLTHGFVSLEMSQGFGLPLDLDETYRRLVDMFLAGLRAGDQSAVSVST
jgi:AcrR family transcriptional regulator